MSASPLLDLFQKNLEVSAVFGLSMCTATTLVGIWGEFY